MPGTPEALVRLVEACLGGVLAGGTELLEEDDIETMSEP
jgi:hypothetical protein